MPIYEYECRECSHRFEAIVRIERVTCLPFLPLRQPRASHLSVCRRCARYAQQVLSAIQKTNAKVTNDKAWADHEYDKKHRNE